VVAPGVKPGKGGGQDLQRLTEVGNGRTIEKECTDLHKIDEICGIAAAARRNK
jgi:UTP:GlnB (protein PII) uridylyltransferase